MFMRYLWSTMKVDISKILNGNKKNPKEVQKVSVKIFGITDEIRDIYIDRFFKYCDNLHMIQFIDWRRRNRQF